MGVFMKSPRKCHLIPPDELCCVWMTAGILTYQLCDRLFDCDHCPMDAAVRRRFPMELEWTECESSRFAPAFSRGLPHEGFQFSRNHWWVKETDRGSVRLGLEADLAQAFVAIKAIVLPALQQRLRRGFACIWVVMDGGTLPLEAPVDGRIRAINHNLLEAPNMISLQPFDAGWLCEVDVAESALRKAGLMTAEEARPRYANDRKRFLSSLAGATRGRRPAVGFTLADGGEQLQGFVDILGPSRYFSQLWQAFGGSKR